MVEEINKSKHPPYTEQISNMGNGARKPGCNSLPAKRIKCLCHETRMAYQCIHPSKNN